MYSEIYYVQFTNNFLNLYLNSTDQLIIHVHTL